MRKNLTYTLPSVYVIFGRDHVHCLINIQRRISNIIDPNLALRLQSLSHYCDVASLGLIINIIMDNFSEVLLPSYIDCMNLKVQGDFKIRLTVLLLN